MKKFVFLFWAMMITTFVHGNPISEKEALAIAKEFCMSETTSSKLKMRARNTEWKSRYVKKVNDRNCIYVVQPGEDGAIFVAGDDRVIPVLGYLDEGTFDPNNMSEGLSYWMEWYSSEIASVQDYEQGSLRKEPMKLKGSVSPLLGSITWNQGAPYNKYCPKVKDVNCWAGCVACAMSQIMRFHKWPKKGKGTKTYTTTTKKFSLTVDFSKTTYNWSNMPNTLIDPTTGWPSTTDKNQINAIALLMYHAGVGANMDYNTNGSGASPLDARDALYNYFSYDSDMLFLSRASYTDAEWKQMLQEELSNGRPVLYSGESSNKKGHAFVIDGYNSKGYFHVNWGWGNRSGSTENGYFLIDGLLPKNSKDYGKGFNLDQYMVTGIQKEDNVNNFSYHYSSSSFSSFDHINKKETNIQIPVGGYTNESATSDSIRDIIALYDETGNLASSMTYFDYYNLRPRYGIAPYNKSIKIPSTLPNGRYTMTYMIQEKSSGELFEPRPSSAENGSAYLTIYDNDISYSTYGYGKISAKTQLTEGLRESEQAPLSQQMTISNAGGAWVGAIYYTMSSEKTGFSYESAKHSLQLLQGKDTVITVNDILGLTQSDDYCLRIYDDSGSVLSETRDIVVEGAPAPELTISEQPLTNVEDGVLTSDYLEITATFKNIGQIPYNGWIVAYLYAVHEGDEKTTYENLGYLDYLTTGIDVEEEATFTFSGSIEEGVANQKYLCALYDYVNGKWIEPFSYSYIYFTLSDDYRHYQEGDVNEDGTVDISDIVMITNIIAGASEFTDRSDVNHDGETDISDIVAVINIIAHPEKKAQRRKTEGVPEPPKYPPFEQ